MKSVILSVLFAISALAGGATPTDKLPLPKKAWAFYGDGVLDLNKVDTTKPVTVDLNREPGHFIRVLLPKSFGAGFDSYRQAIGPGVVVYHSLTKADSDSYSCELVATPYGTEFHSVIAFQAPDGKAVVLVVRIVGKVSKPLNLLSYEKFWKASGYKYPNEAGPQIEPIKPAIILDTAETTFDKDVAIEVMERKHGGKFIAVVREDIQRSIMASGEKVTLPAGTKVHGTVMTSTHGRWHLWAQKVVFPDGSQRETRGNALVAAKAVKAAK